MKKSIIALIAIVILVIIAAIIKFVVIATPGKSVIKKYSYLGSTKDFIAHVQTFFTNDTGAVFKITDTTGTAETGYRFYIDIELKIKGHDVLYGIACENISKSRTSETKVELIMAYDKTDRIGVYNKNAVGVNSLANDFDINFIMPFNRNQNVIITAIE